MNDPRLALVVALRTEHRRAYRWGGTTGTRCALCGQVWPCHAIQAADLLEMQGEALATLRPERS